MRLHRLQMAQTSALGRLALLALSCVSPGRTHFIADNVAAPRSQSGLDTMALKIAWRHFPAGGLVMVVDDGVGGEITSRSILAAGRWPVMVLTSSYKSPRHRWLLRHRASSVVLVGEHRNISRVLGRLRHSEQTWWNSSALFLAVLHRPGDVMEMHRWMLRVQVTNVLMAVTSESEKSGAVPLVTVVPPNAAVCNRHLMEPTLIDEWLPNNTFLEGQAQVFLPPRPEDCRRCEVLVARATSPAMYFAEGRVYEEVFYTIMRHLGCDLHVMELPTGLDDIVPVDESDRLPGAYDRAIRGDADVVLRYAWMTQNRTALLSPSTYLDLQSVEVYVSERFVGLGVLTTLELAVLLVLAVALSINQLLLLFRRRFVLPNSSGATVCDNVPSLLSAWSLFAEQSPARAGKTNAWDSMLWLSLAFGAVSVNTVRRSVYATNAMRPRFVHMTSVEQLIEDAVLVGAHDETIYDVIVNVQKRSHDRVPMLVDCFTDTAQCLRRLPRSEGRFALLLNAPTIYTNLTASERARVRPLSTPYFLFPVTTYFTKDHPLVEAFSTLASRLQDAGITRYKFGRAIAWEPRTSRMIADHPKALRLRDLTPCFNVLKIALPAALVCFLAELVLSASHPMTPMHEALNPYRFLNRRN